MNTASLKSKLKTKALLAMCRRGILLPRTAPDVQSLRTVRCKKEQCELLSDTTNNVIKLKLDGKTCFFRKCRVHASRSDYAQALIDDYFIPGENPDARAWIERSLRSKKNLKRFFNMGVTNDRYSNVSAYYKTGNSALVGIDVSRDAAVASAVSDFVQYAWGEIYGYHLNGGARRNEYQFFNANRSLATRAVAEAIGLEELIPETEPVILDIDGVRYCGTLMANAPGKLVKWETPETRKTMVSGALQHSLNDLNLLDVLCFERDHKPSNYHVTLDGNGKGVSVCAFDNDAPLTFYMHSSPEFYTFMCCSPFVRDGKINRPFMSAKLADALRSLTDDDLKKAVAPYLSKRQIKALCRRRKGLADALKNSVGNGLTLLDDGSWNEQTVQKETSGKYGKTYLNLFFDELHLPKQDWIKNNKENQS